MKKLKSFTLICLSLLLFLSSCKKKCSSSYEFEHPVSVYPIKDSYKINDTIWFEMNFPNVFDAKVSTSTGKNFNKEITLKDFDFKRTFLSFTKLVDDSVNTLVQPSGFWQDYFDPIYITGQIIQELTDGPEYKLIYQNGRYLLKIGMILKQSGRYLYNPLFFPPNFPSVGKGGEQDITPECETEIVTKIRFPVNKQADGGYLTNYHLFEQFMNPALEPDLDRIQKECFTFVVN